MFLPGNCYSLLKVELQFNDAIIMIMNNAESFFFTAFAAPELVLGSEDRTYEAVKFGVLWGLFVTEITFSAKLSKH